ncbi:hypothetical protein EWM64_g9857 [Hericium alpestre]|uniref:Uncharacterized protein n=1 Tax=Hericium alpestre TaxID=135208 RepID=A0A4Y9ZHD3_9AGAM|nr:hypothetical protein EWM64_g9857 [Hericium alpestre]
MYSQPNNSEASLPSPSSSQSHLSTPPPTPPRPVRKQPHQIRLQPIGVDPNCIVGKVLTCVRRSPIHPSISLDFADDTTYQLRVDGYSPTYPGIPREFEMNSAMYPLLHAEGGRADVRLTVSHCRFVSLTPMSSLLEDMVG